MIGKAHSEKKGVGERLANNLTNRQIKSEALNRIKQNPDRMIIPTLYAFSTFIFVMLIEALIGVSAGLADIDYRPFDLDYYRSSAFRVCFPVLRLFVYHVILSANMYFIRRSFIGPRDPSRLIERYISGHVRRILLPCIIRSVTLVLYKLLVLSPISVGIYGVYYFGRTQSMSEIDLFGLVCFMLSIGFTLVWAGVCIHYFISLSLVKYISELNPRANFFDACDLSVKLMEGQHYRLISFYISMLPVFITAVAVYPMLVIMPFFMESRMILSQQIMGDYWQDKLAAMARRWEKQQERKGMA